MTRKELLDLIESTKNQTGSVRVTYASTDDATRVTLTFEKARPMSALEFLDAAVNWVNDFAQLLYMRAREKEKEN